MLVLSRRVGEKIVIDDRITLIVQRVSGNRVSIGIEAPDEVRIIRGELEQIAKSFEPTVPPVAVRAGAPLESLVPQFPVNLPR